MRGLETGGVIVKRPWWGSQRCRGGRASLWCGRVLRSQDQHCQHSEATVSSPATCKTVVFAVVIQTSVNCYSNDKRNLSMGVVALSLWEQ